MRKLTLAAALCCTAATATAAPDVPVCDGSLAREYAQQANRAGSTCHSFVTRFGPSRYNTDECYVMDRYIAMAIDALQALKAKGCSEMDNGPTSGEVAYAVWLGREFDRLRASVWVEGKGWVRL
ncbi:MAG: hypothetical protein ACRC8I_11870 [Plesiomonas shigelloides]